ncbi:hypothetical protein [Streptomyces sp. NPDC001530]|uniref:hypothetical protein n=1 Tax=Streptomyces sp. NPDC001530 TaxID=3364582 RepID=UPI0036B706BE
MPGTVVVLVRSRPGWTLLDRAAELLLAKRDIRVELRRAPAAAGTGPGQRVLRMLNAAPLLVDHVLLAARADPRGGEVRVVEQVLFAAGTRVPPDGAVTARVILHGGPTDNAAAALPLLAGGHQAEDTAPTVLSVHRIALPALGSTEVSFVLNGPGAIDVLASDGTQLTGQINGIAAVDVTALARGVTGRVLPPPPLHLVCAIELAGATVEEAAERIAFLRELVGHLKASQRGHDRLRVGAVGYYDHLSKNQYARTPALVLRVPPSPPASALTAIGTWRPVRRVRDSASALEDALQAAVPLTADRPGARDRSHKVLLVLGRRPPCLPEQVGLVPACTYGIDWRDQLRRLREQGVRVVTRADPSTEPPSRDRTGLGLQRHNDESWRELAAQGSFRPGTDSARDVARALAPPWCTEGPSCPLAFAEPLL